jgi:DeoR/GlpR family transcriptional regulator of sugar metabolism
MRSARKTAVVCIAEKFDTVQKIKICDLGMIDFIITELPPESPALLGYQGKDKPVLL